MRKKQPTPKVRQDTSTKARKSALKKARKTKTEKAKVPRTRNANTMTESEFWAMIRACLRNKTRFWKPRLHVMSLAKRPYSGPNKRQKYEFQCAHCKNHFPQTQVEVNHKTACGTLRSGDDLKGFIEKLFCEADGLEVVCKPCHKLHHEREKAEK